MGRRLGALALLLLAATAWSSATGARAQTAPTVTLRLVGQSVWNGPTRPLDISFSATNDSPLPLTSLAVVLSIWTPARSRSVYDLSLKSDVTTVLLSQPFPQKGVLEPGQTRTFAIREPLSGLGATDNALYPVRLQLLSANTPVGAIRTPMIFLIEHPKVPLNLTWTWVLSDPLQFRPDGTFEPGPIENDIAAGGRLESMVRALDVVRPGPVDIVVSSVLIDELHRMARGYRTVGTDGVIRQVAAGTSGSADAARMLVALRRVASRPATEVVSLPFADASLPALVQGGLAEEISPLLQRGHAAVGGALGIDVRTDVDRPIASQLDAGTLSILAQAGVRTVLLDTSFASTPAGQRFSSQPIVRFAAGGRSVTAVLPDPGVAAVAVSEQSDPQLAAHATLGELAAIWLELPGTADRATAVLFPETPVLPPPYFPTFSALVRGSPWLQRIAASRLETVVETSAREPLAPKVFPGFSAGYLGRLKDAREAWARFASTASEAKLLLGTLREEVFLAESSTFVRSTFLGDRFLSSVQRTIRQTYRHIRITGSTVTLTSRSGFLPITLINSAGFPVHLILRFESDRRLIVVGGDTRKLELSPNSITMTIPVRTETTGRFPIRVLLETPAGGPAADTIAEAQLIVRSTAYNKVALVVTIGAALFLLAWWGRRFLPRKKT